MNKMAELDNLNTCSSGKVEVVVGETIIISPGHGLDRGDIRKEPNPGAYVKVTKNNKTFIIKEVNLVYDFCKLLYAELDKLGVPYINLKQKIRETTDKYTIKERNEVANAIDDKVDAALELCIHVDAHNHGYTGITFFYIKNRPRSKKIAEYFKKKLNEKNLPTRIKDDTETYEQSLGELRNTKAPATLIEIGLIDTEESRKIMLEREPLLAIVLASTLKSFIKDRPNWN